MIKSLGLTKSFGIFSKSASAEEKKAVCKNLVDVMKEKPECVRKIVKKLIQYRFDRVNNYTSSGSRSSKASTDFNNLLKDYSITKPSGEDLVKLSSRDSTNKNDPFNSELRSLLACDGLDKHDSKDRAVILNILSAIEEKCHDTKIEKFLKDNGVGNTNFVEDIKSSVLEAGIYNSLKKTQPLAIPSLVKSLLRLAYISNPNVTKNVQPQALLESINDNFELFAKEEWSLVSNSTFTEEKILQMLQNALNRPGYEQLLAESMNKVYDKKLLSSQDRHQELASIKNTTLVETLATHAINKEISSLLDLGQIDNDDLESMAQLIIRNGSLDTSHLQEISQYMHTNRELDKNLLHELGYALRSNKETGLGLLKELLFIVKADKPLEGLSVKSLAAQSKKVQTEQDFNVVKYVRDKLAPNSSNILPNESRILKDFTDRLDKTKLQDKFYSLVTGDKESINVHDGIDVLNLYEFIVDREQVDKNFSTLSQKGKLSPIDTQRYENEKRDAEKRLKQILSLPSSLLASTAAALGMSCSALNEAITSLMNNEGNNVVAHGLNKDGPLNDATHQMQFDAVKKIFTARNIEMQQVDVEIGEKNGYQYYMTLEREFEKIKNNATIIACCDNHYSVGYKTNWINEGDKISKNNDAESKCYFYDSRLDNPLFRSGSGAILAKSPFPALLDIETGGIVGLETVDVQKPYQAKKLTLLILDKPLNEKTFRFISSARETNDDDRIVNMRTVESSINYNHNLKPPTFTLADINEQVKSRMDGAFAKLLVLPFDQLFVHQPVDKPVINNLQHFV